MPVLRSFAILMLLFALLSCERPPVVGDGAITLDELRGISVANVPSIDGPVQLAAGRWEGAPVAGGVSRPSVALCEELMLTGDVDGDGTQDVVVLLESSGGGSGTFLSMALVRRQGSRVAAEEAVFLGDRVQIRAARLDSLSIVLDLVQAGREDAQCCPGELVTRRWTWTGGTLSEGTPTLTGRLDLSILSSVTWRLAGWSLTEPANDSVAITLTYDGGRFSGSSGCNRYFVSVKTGELPGGISVGLAGRTRMMCTPEVMQHEERYLAALAAVGTFGFHNGRLTLTSMQGSKVQTLIFISQP